MKDEEGLRKLRKGKEQITMRRFEDIEIDEQFVEGADGDGLPGVKVGDNLALVELTEGIEVHLYYPENFPVNQ